MALDYAPTYGSKSVAQQGAGSTTQQRDPAQVWLNIGYLAADGETFVSLPQGAPLDTMKPFEVKGSSEKMKELRLEQNALLADFEEAAAQLQPGERKIITIQVEIRRRHAADVQQVSTNADSAAIRRAIFG
jgi:hypothetical protein